MKQAAKFEIHYYLSDQSHALDAFVRNKCEADFLAIAYEIARELDLPLKIDAEAIKEGGLKDLWKFIGDNSDQIGVILLVLTTVFSYLGIPDSELTALQKEEHQLTIEKLKRELGKGEVDKETIEEGASALINSTKIMVRRSEFYKKLNQTTKINKIGFSSLDENNQPVEPEKKVQRSDFLKFILRDNTIPTEVDEEAEIELVAPVILRGNAKWKGIYQEGSPISFEMKDQDFKATVLNGSISFRTGDVIICVLEIHKKISETGDIKVSKYVVPTVLDKIQGGIRKETTSGKSYRYNKRLASRQQSFLFNDE